jgi:integrase
MLFAGVRPAEVQRLEWSAVDLGSRTISIEGAVAKTRSFRRLHDLPENLWAWLDAAPKKEGAVVPANARNAAQALRDARERAKITEWPHDAMRHSFASYGFHRGLEWVVDTMGHVAGFRTFVRHYKGAASKADADSYFAIAPSVRTICE